MFFNYVLYIRGYFIDKNLLLEQVILSVKHKCITKNDRIIEQIFYKNDDSIIINKFPNFIYEKFNLYVSSDNIIYLKWFDEFAVSLSDIKYIYIKTSPEICDKRIKKRLRDGENVLLAYLQECHYYHETWLNNPEKIESGNVLLIDGNEETNTSQFIENNYFDNIMEKIYKFMMN